MEPSAVKEPTRMLGLREAASYIRRSPGTVYNYVYSGKLRAFKEGMYLLFRIQDLEEFIKPRPRKPRGKK